MKLGVISDTHGYFDPRLPEKMAGVDGILHAGDVGSREILKELEAIAKVHAVRGNVDSARLKLPLKLKKKFGGVQVQVIHQLPIPQSELEAWADGELLGELHPERRGRVPGGIRQVDPRGHLWPQPPALPGEARPQALLQPRQRRPATFLAAALRRNPRNLPARRARQHHKPGPAGRAAACQGLVSRRGVVVSNYLYNIRH